jgi:hypothetical protein
VSVWESLVVLVALIAGAIMVHQLLDVIRGLGQDGIAKKVWLAAAILASLVAICWLEHGFLMRVVDCVFRRPPVAAQANDTPQE